MTTEVDSSAQKQGPWGEAWKEDNNDPYLPDYKFTGKGQDATKLYYYGARYYDPQSSVWLSADPVLGEYLDSVGKGGGDEGVFNSKNLSLYAYCHQNPLNMIDPNGEKVLVCGEEFL